MRNSISKIGFCAAAVVGLLGTAAFTRADAASSFPEEWVAESAPQATATSGDAVAKLDTAVFAGGCFWGVEAVFRHVRGVTSSVSGYAGGTTVSPSYEQVSTGNTGHAEAVQVIYDPAVVSYGALLKVFFSVAHDPTELNRQGPDVGTQYRSAIFTRSDAQAGAAESFISQLKSSKAFRAPIVTEVAPLKKFWLAEAYHQNYLAGHLSQPYIVYNDLPKLDALKKQHPDLYRTDALASN